MFLDPQIRNWILIPIMLIMILVGIVRHNLSIIVRPSGLKKTPSELREITALKRAKLLGENGSILPVSSFNSRREYIKSEFGKKTYLKVKPNSEGDTQQNPIDDPNAVENMKHLLITALMSFLPQTVLMYSINFFFSGLIILKLPFPLTTQYKTMLQRGIETHDMDPTWVSSISWYFLNLFGLQSLYNLILDSNTDTGSVLPIPSPQMMMGKTVNAAKDFDREAETLSTIKKQTPLQGIEDSFISLNS